MNKLVKCNWCEKVFSEEKIINVTVGGRDSEKCPECGRVGFIADMPQALKYVYTYYTKTDNYGTFDDMSMHEKLNFCTCRRDLLEINEVKPCHEWRVLDSKILRA